MSEIKFKEPSEDGTIICVLGHAVKFDGDEVDKITIPPLTGKHIKRIPYRFGVPVTIGQQCEFAGWIVQPEGVFDELHPHDALQVAIKVEALLGKSLQTGGSPSE